MATNRSKNKTKASSRAKKAAAPNGRWLPRLGMYQSKRAITFESEDDLKKALQALWDPADELYRMPRAPGDELTMIVPENAVPLFRARQFKFNEYPVLPARRGPAGSSHVA